MSINVNQASAKIHAFPLGGRRNVGEKARHVGPASVGSVPPKVAVGGAWYHDAAIQDERGRKG